MRGEHVNPILTRALPAFLTALLALPGMAAEPAAAAKPAAKPVAKTAPATPPAAAKSKPATVASASTKPATAKSKVAKPVSRSASVGTFQVSVARLLDFADGNGMSPPLPEWPSTTANRLAKDQADIYLSGVLDVGEGSQWCTGRRGEAVAEVHAEIVHSLRRIKQRDTSAALAVSNVARERFPCKRTT